MRPLNPGQARQHSGRSLHSPIFDYKVVVLGVMYPNVFSRQPSSAATEKTVHLLHDLTSVRRNTAVIFYDPFSPDSEELKQNRPSGGHGRDQQELRRRQAANGRQGTRREDIQAVVSELARLLARKQDHEKSMARVVEECHGFD
jgi:hypothetical protein